MTNFWMQNGKILLSNAGLALFNPQDPCDCPEDIQPCPPDCAACDNPITATITGIAGACPAHENCADQYNGVFSLHRVALSCTWYTDALTLILYCYLQYWIVRDYTMAGCVGWTTPQITGCPPAIGWTWDANYSNCTEGTLILS